MKMARRRRAATTAVVVCAVLFLILSIVVAAAASPSSSDFDAGAAVAFGTATRNNADDDVFSYDCGRNDDISDSTLCPSAENKEDNHGGSSSFRTNVDIGHQQEEADSVSSTTTDNNIQHQECGIYLAPSTIPGAGLGMFAGRPFKEGDTVTTGDIVIPMVDWKHQNAHISVDQLTFQLYYWLTFAFPGMPEESADSYAFSPGAGAALNCHFPLLNVQGYDGATEWSQNGLHRSRDPGVGAFTPYHNRYSYALVDGEAGQELFTDYGPNYFLTNEEHYGKIPLIENYHEADVLLQEYVSIRDDIVMRNHVSDPSSAGTLHHDFYSMMNNMSSRWPSRTLNALPRNPGIVDEIAEIGTTQIDYKRSIRSLDWLQQNGRCMDNLYAKPSLIDQAGRGAFARRKILKGSLIGPAPVVHVDRLLMLMYPREYDENYEFFYKFNRTKSPVSEQLLTNYW